MKIYRYPSGINKMTSRKITDKELKDEQTLADYHFNKFISDMMRDNKII